MGRLFWKFFFFIWLAQLTTIVGVSTTFWLEHRALDQRMAAINRPPGFLPGPPPDGRHLPGGGRSGRPPGEHRLPVVPLIAAMLASLIFAALLARYFSRPIRSLRAAFDAAAAGNLDVRLGADMGRRRDELADLGRNFDHMASHLASLMDGQRRLLHDVSHELRSPLARLQMAIGLARQQPDKIETSLARIERESVRMDKLVGELLTLSRLEVGAVGAMDEEIDLAELVANVVSDARFEAATSERLVSFAAATAAVVTGSAELLHRAVENAVRNAVKHTPDGGCVTVNLRLDAGGHNALISIADRGPGIPESQLGEIFEPFFRCAGTKSTDGHGLGLAIARRVVTAHGGTISASNRVGGGLSVEILLPRA